MSSPLTQHHCLRLSLCLNLTASQGCSNDVTYFANLLNLYWITVNNYFIHKGGLRIVLKMDNTAQKLDWKEKTSLRKTKNSSIIAVVIRLNNLDVVLQRENPFIERICTTCLICVHASTEVGKLVLWWL